MLARWRVVLTLPQDPGCAARISSRPAARTGRYLRRERSCRAAARKSTRRASASVAVSSRSGAARARRNHSSTVPGESRRIRAPIPLQARAYGALVSGHATQSRQRRRWGARSCRQSHSRTLANLADATITLTACLSDALISDAARATRHRTTMHHCARTRDERGASWATRGHEEDGGEREKKRARTRKWKRARSPVIGSVQNSQDRCNKRPDIGRDHARAMMWGYGCAARPREAESDVSVNILPGMYVWRVPVERDFPFERRIPG
jgi:hypothetical protein